MPDDLPDDDLDHDDPNDSNVVKQLRRQTREQKARLKELEDQAARAAEAERRLRFAEADVPLSDPRAKYFVKGYDGEDDVAAVRAAWQEFAGGAPAVDSQASIDMAAMDRIAKASAGATVDDPTPDQQKYLAELEALKHNGIRDPAILQRMAIDVFQKHGVRLHGE